MYLSRYSELNILRCFSGTPFVAPSSVYVALSSTDPRDDGSGLTEPTYTGYARRLLSLTAPAPMASIANSIGFQNDSEIKFAKAETDQAAITHLAAYDSLTAGNLLFFARLEAPKTIRADVEPIIREGEARFWFASAHTTDTLKTRMLNVFRGVTLAAITPYASLANDVTEIAGGNFARVRVTFTSPAQLATGPYAITNAALVEFAIASIALGNYNTDCIFDSVSGGNKLIAYTGAQDYYAAGDRTAYDPGDWQFSLN